MSFNKDIKTAYSNWYIFLVLGLVFIFFGIYIFSSPLETMLALGLIFAIGMIMDGVGDIVFSVRNRAAMNGWGWQLSIGVISTLIGISLIGHPDVSVIVLPLYVGFWMLLKGLLLAGIAFELRNQENNFWRLVIGLGGLNGIFGILLILNPIFGATLIASIAGLGIISIGLSLVYVGFRVRKVMHVADAQLVEDTPTTNE